MISTMSDESGHPAAVGQAGQAPTPPMPPAAPIPDGAPTPPPPLSTYASPRRKRPVRTVGGIVGVLVIIGAKLLAVAGVSHLLHGASPIVIVVVLIVVSFLFRPWLRRFFGR
jgi:hypothetical protein